MSTPASFSGFSGDSDHQLRVHLDRAQVGKHTQPFAQLQQPLLRAHLGRRVIPLGTADRAQQHRIGRLAGRQGFIGQRRAIQVDRAAADQMLANR